MDPRGVEPQLAPNAAPRRSGSKEVGRVSPHGVLGTPSVTDLCSHEAGRGPFMTRLLPMRPILGPDSCVPPTRS